MDKKTFQRKFLSKSSEETEEIGKNFAEKIIRENSRLPRREPQVLLRGSNSRKFARILSLEGELGGGKTTFLKGFGRGLGIKDRIKSPTFVIMRRYYIPTGDRRQATYRKLPVISCQLRYFYHFDCYRIDSSKEILELGWEEIISNPENIVAVEWGDKIKNILPEKTIKIIFKTKKENERELIISNCEF